MPYYIIGTPIIIKGTRPNIQDVEEALKGDTGYAIDSKISIYTDREAAIKAADEDTLMNVNQDEYSPVIEVTIGSGPFEETALDSFFKKEFYIYLDQIETLVAFGYKQYDMQDIDLTSKNIIWNNYLEIELKNNQKEFSGCSIA